MKFLHLPLHIDSNPHFSFCSLLRSRCLFFFPHASNDSSPTPFPILHGDSSFYHEPVSRIPLLSLFTEIPFISHATVRPFFRFLLLPPYKRQGGETPLSFVVLFLLTAKCLPPPYFLLFAVKNNDFFFFCCCSFHPRNFCFSPRIPASDAPFSYKGIFCHHTKNYGLLSSSSLIQPCVSHPCLR